jgi:hypothetical protein
MKAQMSLGAALAAFSLILGCSDGGSGDAGDSGYQDSGQQDACVPSDAGYCGVCHVMTSCGEYPPGPYGMQTGLVLPPCFQADGFWNPYSVWLNDGGNPVVSGSIPFFENLYCAGQQQGQKFALVQVANTGPYSVQSATYLSECTDGPDWQWASLGGQVLQILEQQASNGFPVDDMSLAGWAQHNESNYSLGTDTGQVLNPIIDSSNGYPVTYIVDLSDMKIRFSRSYGADTAQLGLDFSVYLDGGGQ